jgi:Rha family phage regulatory protein
MESIKETTTTVSTPRDRKISSMIVAAILGESHESLLNSINKLYCSKEFAQSNLGPGSYWNKNGKKRDIILMTGKGLFFLAMSLNERKFIKMQNKLLGKFIKKQIEYKGKQIEDINSLREATRFWLKIKGIERDYKKLMILPGSEDFIMAKTIVEAVRLAWKGIEEDYWGNEATPNIEKLTLQSTIETASPQLSDFDNVTDYVRSLLGVSLSLEQAVKLEQIEEERVQEIENKIGIKVVEE